MDLVWVCTGQSTLFLLSHPFLILEVPVPADFGLPYEELVLRTPDGINIRAFLLLQTRKLDGDMLPTSVNTGPKETDKEVSRLSSFVLGTFDLSSFSSQAEDRRY
jgi:hypothetical protein